VEWKNYLHTQNFASIDDALKAARTSASFFFYCREHLDWDGRSYRAGDAVFFTGPAPNWSQVAQCDVYYLGGPCTNLYNCSKKVGACPSDLQQQYKTWGSSIDGGFIWSYDSVIGCLLSGCCGGSISKPAGTALAYRQAISAD
jgi:hypothetical protein